MYFEFGEQTEPKERMKERKKYGKRFILILHPLNPFNLRQHEEQASYSSKLPFGVFILVTLRH